MTNLSATLVLIRKNFLLSIRESSALAITLLAPFFALLILYFRQLSIDQGEVFAPELLDNPNPEPRIISTIPRCVSFATDSCFTIAFVPDSNSRVEQWVSVVAQRSGIPKGEIQSFSNSKDLNDHLVANPNTTQAAYIFNDYALEQINDNNVSFIVQYNESLQFEFPLGETSFHKDVVLPAMIHQMNLAMMPDLSDKLVDVNLNLSLFPHPNLIDPDVDQALDAFSQDGGFVTYATFFLSVLFFLYRIVREKECGLRDAMRLAGQTQAQHYISWLVPYFLVNLIIVFELIIFGLIFNFEVFRNVHFGVYFFTMFFFSLSLMAITMLLATIIVRSTTVSVLSFMVFIFTYVLGSSGSIVYDTDLKESVRFLRQLFAIFPPTMYIKAIFDMTRSAAIPGKNLTLDNVNSSYPVFPILECWYWMLGATAVYLLLSIYLDNVVPTEHGARLPLFYPFQWSYWFPRRATEDIISKLDKSQQSEDDSLDDSEAETDTHRYDPNVEDADVQAERQAVASGVRNDAALVIKNISRKFRGNLAVDDVSFSVSRNTAFALLGHNGAGKLRYDCLFEIHVLSFGVPLPS